MWHLLLLSCPTENEDLYQRCDSCSSGLEVSNPKLEQRVAGDGSTSSQTGQNQWRHSFSNLLQLNQKPREQNRKCLKTLPPRPLPTVLNMKNHPQHHQSVRQIVPTKEVLWTSAWQEWKHSWEAKMASSRSIEQRINWLLVSDQLIEHVWRARTRNECFEIFFTPINYIKCHKIIFHFFTSQPFFILKKAII